jgi:hypothetical protein
MIEAQLVKKFPTFMESAGSLVCSEETRYFTVWNGIGDYTWVHNKRRISHTITIDNDFIFTTLEEN